MTEGVRPRVLVTGGTGFIGTELVGRLVSDSFEVAVFDARDPQNGFPNDVNVITGDLRNTSLFAKTVRSVRPQAVVHLASNIGARGYLEEHANEIVDDNTAIDSSLYAGIEDSDVGLVIYTSSSMVFENATAYPYYESDLRRRPNDPRSVPTPTNLYGQSKYIGEALTKRSGKPHIITRYHNVYGPSEKPKGEGAGNIHVIPAAIEKVKTGTLPVEILGNPQDTRPFTYIDDAVEATVRLLNAGLRGHKAVINEDFNIGPQIATRIIDLYRIIWKMSGSHLPFSFVVDVIKGTTAHRREMNPGKIYKAVRWTAKTRLEEGLVLTDPTLVNANT